MAEVKQYEFSFKEVVEALIKQQDLHEGIWGLHVEFGLQATNLKVGNEETVLPAAIMPIMKLGLIKESKITPLAVDAAQVNPSSKKK